MPNKQRKAELSWRMVYKSLPDERWDLTHIGRFCTVCHRFAYQGLTRWYITLQTKKRVWQEVHSKCCSTWTGVRRKTALSPSWDGWQSTGLWHRKLSEFTDFVKRYFPYVEKLMPTINFLRERLGFNDGITTVMRIQGCFHNRQTLFFGVQPRLWSQAFCLLYQGRWERKVWFHDWRSVTR